MTQLYNYYGMTVWFRIGLEPILSAIIQETDQFSSEMVVWEAPHASILLFFPCKVCTDKVCWKGKYQLFHGSHGKFKLRNFWNPSTALAELRVSPINHLIWLTHFHWPSKHLAKNTKEWTICTASSREGKQKAVVNYVRI